MEGLLNTESRRRQRAEDLLQDERRHSEAAGRALEAERYRRETAENQLTDKSTEALEIQKRWKQVARELNNLRSQQQVFHILTDDYLVERAKNLRYSIQNLAIQYYGGDPPMFQRTPEMHHWFSRLLGSVVNLKTALMSPAQRSNAIQAILWQVLLEHVFDGFCWMQEAPGSAMEKLRFSETK